MSSKFIIFGCGMLGHEMIDAVGRENVECFCDNNSELAGSEKYGKRIISFDELKEKYHNAMIIICADLRKGYTYAIAEQCEKNGILDYFPCQVIRESEIFQNRGELLLFLRNPENRISLKNIMYVEKVRSLQRQVNYLKRHIDIRHIKPAGGKLRARQLELVYFAAELLQKLNALEIKPFLYGGNLLGYVRHNGFIPWDDDIDFALMREDYEKLRAYCRVNMYTEEEFYSQEKSDKNIRKDLKCYYWGNGGGDEFNIYQLFPDGSKNVFDFFVLDYYADDYSYDALMKLREEVRIKLNDAIPDKEKAGGAVYDDAKRIKCFQEVLMENRENIVRESNHIYFGIDNMDMMLQFHRGQWIPKEVVFPLRKVLYEGMDFWVPNDAEEFLKYEFKNIWELPDDIGIPQHVREFADILMDEENW